MDGTPSDTYSFIYLFIIKIVHKVQIKERKKIKTSTYIKTYIVKQWTVTCSRNSPLHRRCRRRNARQKSTSTSHWICRALQCQHPQQKKNHSWNKQQTTPKHKQFKCAYRSAVILCSSPMQTDIMHPMLIKLLTHQVINRHRFIFRSGLITISERTRSSAAMYKYRADALSLHPSHLFFFSVLPDTYFFLQT